MDLRRSTLNAISIAALCGLSFDPSADPPASAAPEPLAPARDDAPAPDGGTDASDPSDASTSDDPTCGPGMVLVEGDYCPDVEQICSRWLDPPPYAHLRCAEFEKPVRCRTARVHKRFCIDREEYHQGSDRTDAGEALPLVRRSWLVAEALCEARGARLCKESEWILACEGPDMQPYPYGYVRDSTICNFDRTDLGGAEDKLTDHRAPPSAFPQCLSPYGVHDMVGNVDEFTERENVKAPNRNALHGGWWLPGRNRCRAATLHHSENYGGKQVGFRCCSDAP